MKQSARDYRMSAKERLSGNWGPAIGAFVVFGLLIGALSSTGAGYIILFGSIYVGYATLLTRFLRSGKIDFNDLFAPFKKDFLNTLVFGVLYTIFLTLWIMLFVIPGIIKAYSYSMAPYILADYPDISGIDAITASRKLMKGKKGRLFCLDLSFIGWVILSALTLGILTLWVGPWMDTAHTEFYESIKDEVPALIGRTEPSAEAAEAPADGSVEA